MYCKGAVVVYFEVLSRHSPEGTEKNNEEKAVRRVDDLEIRSSYLPNTSQRIYCVS
jgi:hypothetical protein